MSTRIVTDSTSYLPHNLRRELDIEVVSLSVSFDDETYQEDDIDNIFFYEKMSRSKEIPTSSQPTTHDLYNTFKRLVAAGHAVVGVFLSSDMSGTCANATMAKNLVLKESPQARIEIIDSRSNCMQLGFVAVAAAKAAKAGRSFLEVLREAQDVIGKSRFLFVPDTLQYLKKGGRIGGAAALLGSILKIRPILTVIDGKTAVFNKVRTKGRAVRNILDIFFEDVARRGLVDVAVHHINNETEGMSIAQIIESRLGRRVPVCSIGPVIGLHVGPGAVGVVYYTERGAR